MFLIIFIVSLFAIVFLVPSLLFAVVWVIGRLCRYKIRYRPYLFSSLVLAVLLIVLMGWGYYYRLSFYNINKVEFSHKDVPAGFDGYRIVHISDLHLDGWKGHEEKLARILCEIDSLQPDVVCFTGDLVSLSPDELTPFLGCLSRIEAKDGVFSVLGNHDYFPYRRNISDEEREERVRRLSAMQRDSLGWHLLLNENFKLRRGGDSISVMGCENQSVGFHSVVKRGDLMKTMEGADAKMKILMTHDPTQWRKEVVGKTDTQLTLSGHTHALQMRVLGFTPSKWFYPECDGLYEEGKQSLYVNIGLGGTLPMRLGATPEITLITLHHQGN